MALSASDHAVQPASAPLKEQVKTWLMRVSRKISRNRSRDEELTLAIGKRMLKALLVNTFAPLLRVVLKNHSRSLRW